MKRTRDVLLAFGAGAMTVSFLLWVWQPAEDTVQNTAIPGIRPGSTVPNLLARSITGASVAVDFDDVPTVLYVLSPICEWCERNHANIVKLATEVSDRFRFIGIFDSTYSIDLVRGHLQDYPLPFDVLMVNSSDLGLDLSVTPQTVVVVSDGLVQHAWNGALFGRSLSYAEYVFDVRLPGLIERVDDAPVGPQQVCYSADGASSEGAVLEVEGVLSRCHLGQWVPLSDRGP